MKLSRSYPCFQFDIVEEDISAHTEWRIERAEHTLVVHLDGRMSELRTRLSGVGQSFGPAAPGEVWSAPAGAAYESAARGDRIRYALLRIPPSAMSELSGGAGPLAQLAPLAGVHDEFLYGAAVRLSQVRCGASDLVGMLEQHTAWAAALHVAERYGGGVPVGRWSTRTSRLHPESVRLVQRFIEENLSESLTLAQLAAAARVPEHRFAREFRAVFGVTPWQYVLSRRLERAASLLRHTGRSVVEIALECGFSSHSHLTTCMRARTGATPSQIRRDGALE